VTPSQRIGAPKIVPSDPDYLATKRIRLGQERMDEPEAGLAEAISREFGILPLNILYEWEPVVSRPRLMIVLERWAERSFFMQGPWDIKPELEARLRASFNASALFHRAMGPAAEKCGERAFLILKAFEPIANAESNHRIPKEVIEDLRHRFEADGVWVLSRYGSIVTCFFGTRRQREHAAANGMQDRIRSAYGELLRAHDQFGYITDPGKHVSFDDKENLDRNYEGSLFNYYR
jgi:hypothetical protein